SDSLFFISYYIDHRNLYSFPTRRSSDLTTLTMMKIRRSLKFKRQQNFFIISVISLFSLIAFLITGFLLKEYIFSVGPSSYDLTEDRKSTRLNSSHVKIWYAVFCLKKNTK